MTPQNGNQDEVWMQQRIQQLRNQLDEMSGGTAMFGGMGEQLPPELELQFLEHVRSFEAAETTTLRKILSEEGYRMATADTLSELEISTEVWEVLQRLADIHCYLDATDHLSDRGLYEKIDAMLDEPAEDFRLMGEGSACFLEVLNACEEEDDQTWLKYYADEETRQMWHLEFGTNLPEKEAPPYDRDRLLPRPVFPEM